MSLRWADEQYPGLRLGDVRICCLRSKRGFADGSEALQAKRLSWIILGAKEHQLPGEAGKDKRRILPGASRRNVTFRLLAYRAVK